MALLGITRSISKQPAACLSKAEPLPPSDEMSSFTQMPDGQLR